MEAPPSDETSPPESPTGSPKQAKRRSFGSDDPTRIWDDLPKHLKIKKRTAYIRRHSDLMVTSNYRKFTLLMWKNYINTKRQWKTSTVQLTAPAFLVTILVIIVSNRQDSHYEQRIYDPFNIDVMPASTFGQECKSIYLQPDTPAIREFKDHLQNAISRNLEYKFSQDDLDVIPYRSDLCALIEFKEYDPIIVDSNSTSTVIRYDIRFPGVLDSGRSKSSLTSIGKRWDTSFRFPPYLIDGPREITDPYGGHPGYYKHGFLYIQHLIAMELAEIIYVKEKMKRNTVPPIYSADHFKDEFSKLLDKLSVRLRRFPFPSHRNEGAVRVIHDTLPVVLVTGFGISCMVMVYLTVHEKEMGIRILLKMYGIDQTFHRYAWILHNLIMLSISSLLITAILSTNWTSDGPGIFNDVVSHVFLLLIVCYVFNLICTVLLIVCFFSRASTACISVCFIWTVTFVPYIYVRNNYNILEFWQRIASCIFFNTAIAIGCHIISEVEALDEGLNWHNVFGHNIKDFSLGWVMITMVLVGLLKFLLAQYISKVFPDAGIQSLPWNFMFTSWFWNDQLPPDDSHVPYARNDEKSFEENHPQYFEDDSNTKRRKELSIENVSKYHRKLRALHKLNLICHQGNVTVLLGDQGSGKSTLLQMLNGTMAPSSGTIFLSRKDLYKNPVHGRAFVGYCPPQDLLFPDLTVDETLQFFTELKGLTNRIEAYEEVERFLQITMLADYRDTRVCDLTKSSQRMLMVATAFCGGSRVVLLDDPTLNLSAAQQRVLWDFTGQEKKHRTILVAMDLVHEVDSVVDRIVLLHYGQMTCKGSPEFLQNNFGGGYHLEIESEQINQKNPVEVLISRRVSGSRLFTIHENTLDFYLPQSQTASFPGLLEELETSQETYGIKSFKINFITLEELHLRLKRKSASLDDVVTADTDNKPRKSKIRRRLTSRTIEEALPETDFKPMSDKAGKLREFRLMFLKNVRYTWRKTGLLLLATFIPLTMLTITHFLSSALRLRDDLLPHELNYSVYAKPEIVADIYKSTNEGFYMRDSVKRILSTANGFKQKDVPFHEDIVTEILKHYQLHHNENSIPNLGVEIFPVKETVVSSSVTSSTEVKVGVTGYFNNQPLHTPAIALALIDNILMDYVEDKIRRDAIIHKQPKYEPKGYYFQVGNHPLNYQPADLLKYYELFIGPGYIFGICSAFSYSFLIASFIIMHIDEREFRHLQMIAGASKIIFWASNYLWNFILFTVVALGHLAIISFLGIPGFPDDSWKHTAHIGSTFLFISIYGITAICIVGSHATYPYLSWGRGYSRIALLFLISGPLIMLVLIPLQNVLPISRYIFTAIHNILLFLPSYAFGTGLYYIVTDYVYHVECELFLSTRSTQTCDNLLLVTPFNEFSHDGSTEQSCCFNNQLNAFSWVAYGVGRNALTMILVAACCVAHKIFSNSKKKRMMEKKAIEKKARKWRPVIVNEHEVRDYDVLAETAKIYRGDDSRDFTIRNLTLETPLYVRVDNMCLEVTKGECFALLGSTGSGKTIFLKTICGYPGFFSTYGDVEIHGFSLNTDYDKYISYISYCPNQNPFLSELSGLEVLELIGSLRKIPPDTLDSLTEYYTANLGFKNEIELPISGYSHVHAKKLSVAAALLGKFEVLLLDEPLDHLDPKSRQFIISSVKRLMQDGCMVVWTAHSIEQCENICTKMSILVNGSLRCIGSLTHLRGLYEEGYTVIVRFLLDRDMIYFTSKKNIRMEHELRENDVEDDLGINVGQVKQEQRKKTLTDALGDAELALSELAPCHWHKSRPTIFREQDLCPFVAYFERAFPDSILVDKQPGFIHYHVNKNQAAWSVLFRKMEEAKAVAEVDSYYIACTNLDQVFFNFTRGQISFEG